MRNVFSTTRTALFCSFNLQILSLFGIRKNEAKSIRMKITSTHLMHFHISMFSIHYKCSLGSNSFTDLYRIFHHEACRPTKSCILKKNYNEVYYCTVTELPRAMSLEIAKHHVGGKHKVAENFRARKY